jgi:hypothetical protein
MKKILLFITLILCCASLLLAQPTDQINYQAVARNNLGAILANQTVGLRLSIETGSGGPVVYQERQAPTTNQFGLFTIALGSGTVLSGTYNTVDWFSGNQWLKVEMDPKGGSAYVNMGESQLLAVPYANYAEETKAVDGTLNYIPRYTSARVLGISNMFDNGSSVGVFTNTPDAMTKLHVVGVGTYGSLPYYQAGIVADGGTTAANATGVFGSSGWRGVYGYNPGIATGTEAIGVQGTLEGSSYTFGYGVKGVNNGTGTTNYGVYGVASGNGHGVAGVVSGTGAAGRFDGGASGYGVIVVAGNSGFNTTTPNTMGKVNVSGVGIYGSLPFYQAGLVVDGVTTASSSGTYSTGGWRGVFGHNPGTSGGTEAIGVEGKLEGSSYTSGYGVKGEAIGTGPTNYGVYGIANNSSGNDYGIYGSSSQWAGYFAGNVNITGSIAKGSGTFKIDHPLDPENKYLYHSFVESPDMMNIYNGNIVTDANGNATVTLPDYFDALNKDFRYQLTVIGTYAQAIVKEEISGNRFTIQTDKPNVKVSWMVTGVRQDKFANAHRVVPEVEKENIYKGYYLHAAEWGMPANKSIDHLTAPQPSADNRKE